MSWNAFLSSIQRFSSFAESVFTFGGSSGLASLKPAPSGPSTKSIESPSARIAVPRLIASLRPALSSSTISSRVTQEELVLNLT